jgi:hypothetical protein
LPLEIFIGRTPVWCLVDSQIHTSAASTPLVVDPGDGRLLVKQLPRRSEDSVLDSEFVLVVLMLVVSSFISFLAIVLSCDSVSS